MIPISCKSFFTVYTWKPFSCKRLGLYPVLTVMIYFKGSLSVKSWKSNAVHEKIQLDHNINAKGISHLSTYPVIRTHHEKLVLSHSLWNTIESRHLFLCKTTNLSIYKKKNKLLGIFLISARLIDVKKMLAGKKKVVFKWQRNNLDLWS